MYVEGVLDQISIYLMGKVLCRFYRFLHKEISPLQGGAGASLAREVNFFSNFSLCVYLGGKWLDLIRKYYIYICIHKYVYTYIYIYILTHVYECVYVIS